MSRGNDGTVWILQLGMTNLQARNRENDAQRISGVNKSLTNLPAVSSAHLRDLNEAAFLDRYQGLFGHCAPKYYKVLIANTLSATAARIAWTDMILSAQKTNNIATVIRALVESNQMRPDDENASDMLMFQGHYMRRLACDYPESAKAYAQSGKNSWNDALAATIALQRLHRDDPQCDETRLALEAIRSNGMLVFESKTDIEKKLASISPDNEKARTNAWIDLAIAVLIDWGDVNTALGWLETSLSYAQAPRSRIIDVAAAIARANIDNRPTLERAVHLLKSCDAYEQISRLAALSIYAYDLALNTGTDDIDIIFAEICARKMGDEKRASAHLHRTITGLLDNNGDLRTFFHQNTWIFEYAANHTGFRQILINDTVRIKDAGIVDDVLKTLSEYAPPDFACECDLERIHRCSISLEQSIQILSAHLDRLVSPNCGLIRKLFDTLIDLESAPDAENYHREFQVCTQKLQKYAAQCHISLKFHQAKSIHNEPVHSQTLNLHQVLNAISFDEPDINEPYFMDENPEDASFFKAHPDAHDSFVITDDFIEAFDHEDALGQALSLIEAGDCLEAISLFFKSCHRAGCFEQNMALLTQLDDKISSGNETRPHASPWPGTQSDNISLTALCLAYILDTNAQFAPWMIRIEQAAEGKHARWLVAVQTFLRYLPFVSQAQPLTSAIVSICTGRLDKSEAFEVLFDNYSITILFDALFDQVLRMSENTNQRQMLEKLDDAIAMYAGDPAQKNALLAKKFKIAEMLGDERIKMTCLHDILETTPNDEFAAAELRKLNPDQLKPHAQILYYQLLTFIDTNDDQRLAHQMTLAALYSRSAQLNNAINLYYAIIDDHPDFIDARYELLDLLESLGNWKSAENILLALINVEPSPQKRFQCLVRLAEIQYARMMMPARALLTLFAAIDIDPLKLSALHEQLCEISDHANSYPALLDKYEDMADNAQTYEIRRMATVLLANIYAERIQKPAQACNLLDNFFEKEGKTDPEFLQVVANFFEEVEYWDGYAKVATALMPLISQPEDRTQLALSVAHIQASQLRNSLKASQFARLAAQNGSQNPDIWLEIAGYLVQSGNNQDALDALTYAEKLESDTDRKLPILFEIVQMFANADRLTDAAPVFHRIAQLNPPLEHLTPVAEDLIALATSHQNKDIFMQLCDDLVQCCPQSEHTDLQLQKALTLIRIFDDKSSARQILEKVKENLGPLDIEQHLILAQIFTSLDENEMAIRTTKQALQKYALTDAQRLECLQILLTNAKQTSNTDLTRHAANDILKLDAENSNAIFALIQLDYQTGKWDEAAERIQAFLPHLERLNAQNAMLLHYYYGEILYAAQNPDLAIECLDNALRIRTDYRPAVNLKLTILLENQRWPEALPIFELLLKLTPDTEEQGAIHKRIAEIYHFYIHNTDAAIQQYEVALSLGGDVEDVPMRLLQLYQEAKLWQKAAMTAHILAMAQIASPDAKASYLLVLGDIQANQLGEFSNAVNSLLEAFMINPMADNAMIPLVQLLIKRNDTDNICGVFNILSSLIPKHPDEAKEKLQWLAQVSHDLPQCKDAIRQADQSLRQHGFDIDLEHFAAKNPIDIEQDSKRKRINTSPRGSLTVDSSLIKNPELPPTAPHESQISIVQHEVSHLPDDALLPIDNDNDDFDIIAIEEIHPQIDDSIDIDDSTEIHFIPPIPPAKSAPSSPAHKPISGNTPIHAVKPYPQAHTFGSSQNPKLNLSHSPQTPAASLAAITQSFDNLTFDIDSILELQKSAQQSRAYLTRLCLNDLLDIASKEHETLAPFDLPDDIPILVRQNLYSARCSSITPGMQKLLTALAALPPLTETADLQDAAPSSHFYELFQKISRLLSIGDLTLKTRPLTADLSLPLVNTSPVGILCSNAENLTPHAWVAQLTMAISLARPESRLTGSMTPAAIHQLLNQASTAMNPMRSKSAEIDENTQKTIKSTLSAAGITSATMPRITQESLLAIKQFAAFNRKIAIQAALILSQSLLDCLQILAEIENIRFPSTLASLKSAMKQSPAIHDLVCFAISANAQRLHSRIFSSH